jgi:hypothetical protein
LELAYT